jgi:RimJ/RimL family protein N-acetyltransferase
MAAIEHKNVTLKNGQEVCIRTPIAEDTSSVIKYLKAVFADDRFFMTTAEEAKEWQTIEKEQEHIQKNYEDENKLMVVTEINGSIVSFSNVHAGERKRNHHIGQIGISILPQFRGIGLGTAIMEAMIDWARAHPVIEKLALGVWAANKPAIQLYEKMGFKEEGRKIREIKYTDGSYDDCICMYRFVK